MPRARRTPKPTPPRTGQPFDDSEEAWFWAVRGHDAMIDGARPIEGAARIPRPCEPRDIMIAVSHLARSGAIARDQVDVLFRHARRGMPPNRRHHGEAGEARLWDEALGRLETVLRKKGLIAAGDGAFPGRSPTANRGGPTS